MAKSDACAVYNILGIRVDGRKEILGLWIQESESKPAWMQIFDELKSRGVQEVGFISMDGVSGLEEGAKAIFPEVVVQNFRAVRKNFARFSLGGDILTDAKTSAPTTRKHAPYRSVIQRRVHKKISALSEKILRDFL